MKSLVILLNRAIHSTRRTVVKTGEKKKLTTDDMSSLPDVKFTRSRYLENKFNAIMNNVD